MASISEKRYTIIEINVSYKVPDVVKAIAQNACIERVH